MKIELKDIDAMPVFGRAAARIEKDELLNAGVAFESYGIAEGDVVVIPEDATDYTKLRKQATSDRQNPNYQYLLPVMRGKSKDALEIGWLSLGSLIRQDGNRNYTCDFTKEMGTKFKNHEQRLSALAGKTIVGKASIDGVQPEFKREVNPTTGVTVSTLVRKPNGETSMIPAKFTVVEYAA